MPPVIVGGALVIPRGLLNQLMGRPGAFSADAAARRAIELAAMQAVMETELALGFIPVEVDGVQTKTVYLKKPFRERPDFAATSVNYDISDLINTSSRHPTRATARLGRLLKY